MPKATACSELGAKLALLCKIQTTVVCSQLTKGGEKDDNDDDTKRDDDNKYRVPRATACPELGAKLALLCKNQTTVVCSQLSREGKKKKTTRRHKQHDDDEQFRGCQGQRHVRSVSQNSALLCKNQTTVVCSQLSREGKKRRRRHKGQAN